MHALAGRTVWTIFDNTASGAALANALTVVEAASARLAAGAPRLTVTEVAAHLSAAPMPAAAPAAAKPKAQAQ